MVLFLGALQGEPFLAVPEADYGWEVPSPDARVAVLIDRLGRGRVWNVQGRIARLDSVFQTQPLAGDLSMSPNGFYAMADRQGARVALMPQNEDRLTVARLRPFAPLWSRRIKPAYGLPLDWSPDGRTLLVQTDAGTRLFSRDGRDLGELPIRAPLAFRRASVYGLAKGGIAGFDLPTRRPLRRLADPQAGEPLGVSPDGRWLVAGSHRGDRYRYRVWRLSDGRAVGECPGPSQNLNEGFDPEFVAPNRFRLNGLREEHALPSGRLVARLPGWMAIGYSESGANPARMPRAAFPPATDPTHRASPQPDGGLLIANGRRAVVLEPRRGRIRAVPLVKAGARGFPTAYPGPGGAVYRVFPGIPQGALSREGAWEIRATGRFTSRPLPTPDGRAVVIAEQRAEYDKLSDARLRILDAATGREIRSLDVPDVHGLALSPDGRTAALRTPEGIELRPLDGSPGRRVPNSATASSDLFWWGADRVVTLGSYPQAIDVRTARVVAHWATWTDGAWVAWTPDGAADGNRVGLARLYRARGTGVAPFVSPVRPADLWRALGPRVVRASVPAKVSPD